MTLTVMVLLLRDYDDSQRALAKLHALGGYAAIEGIFELSLLAILLHWGVLA